MTINTEEIGPAREYPHYGRLALRPMNQLAVIAPLLVLFHIGAAIFGSRLLAPYFIRIVFRWFGMPGILLPSTVIVIVLICQHIARKDPWRPDALGVAGIVIEGIIWTLPLLAAGWIIGTPSSAAVGDGGDGGLLYNFCESFGAGIYEEFVFRLVLIHGAAVLFTDLAGLKHAKVMICASIVSALLFSICHFPLADLLSPMTLDWERFAFLATAGGWWAVLLSWRGYGIAACSHIIWNLTAAIAAAV